MLQTKLRKKKLELAFGTLENHLQSKATGAEMINNHGCSVHSFLLMTTRLTKSILAGLEWIPILW